MSSRDPEGVLLVLGSTLRTAGGPHEFPGSPLQTLREYCCPGLYSKDGWRAPRVPGSPLRQVMGTERCRSGELRSSYSSHCDVLSVVGEDSRTMEHRVKHLLVVTGLLVANLDSGRCVTCWMCSSIIAGQDDCKDPFNVSRSFGYKVNCDHEISSPPPGHKQYCKKIVLQLIGTDEIPKHYYRGSEVTPVQQRAAVAIFHSVHLGQGIGNIKTNTLTTSTGDETSELLDMRAEFRLVDGTDEATEASPTSALKKAQRGIVDINIHKKASWLYQSLSPNIHSGVVTERSCAWADESDPQASSCPSLNLRVDFCGVCTEDGCNGSPSYVTTSIMRNEALLGFALLIHSLARAS
uniref:Protein quiver n=1 Tax=Timema tahoe TaxID=61484 RepID=A0A7R9IGY1_9NEOP|nr:unnamed protein product [Timema tahoe]